MRIVCARRIAHPAPQLSLEAIKGFEVLQHLSMAFVEYNITRPFSRWYSITVFVLGIIWIVFITFINVAAVGYEGVTIITASYNGTNELWFERFIPNSWKPTTLSCSPNIIQLGDGYKTPLITGV
jgi:hypothetical protein